MLPNDFVLIGLFLLLSAAEECSPLSMSLLLIHTEGAVSRYVSLCITDSFNAECLSFVPTGRVESLLSALKTAGFFVLIYCFLFLAGEHIGKATFTLRALIMGQGLCAEPFKWIT